MNGKDLRFKLESSKCTLFFTFLPFIIHTELLILYGDIKATFVKIIWINYFLKVSVDKKNCAVSLIIRISFGFLI